ncbi:MAG TPA: SMP-30/gluconolactonase/LRE family protein [Acidimicrobiales bacterium]|nr:SMP-30/gluconolactonase/LRE family protein [Acidimicrobiales bacterium]
MQPRTRERSRWLAAVFVAPIAILNPSSTAVATGSVQRIVSFDASAGELPESLAVDRRGTIYVSLAPIGQVRAVAADGGQRVVATLPVGSGFGALGLAFGPRDDLYVAVSTFDPATNGVYRVGRNGTTTRLPGTETIVLPNGLAFDRRGNLFVTDSVDGAIWRVPHGGTAELWLRHPLLAGDNTAPPPVPLGANGIAWHNGTLFVTNTETGSVITVPVGRNGSPGAPAVLARGPALVGADGLAIDATGNLYIAVNGQSTVVRVSSDGANVTTLATAADGLDFPSDVAFGSGRRDRRTLFAVNFAIGPVFGFPPGAGPALLALDVGSVGAGA